MNAKDVSVVLSDLENEEKAVNGYNLLNASSLGILGSSVASP